MSLVNCYAAPVTSKTRRVHTGPRRNEGARAAILASAADLMAESELASVTIDAIAARAGVGRQTIYRWWPTKGALLSNAMSERAAELAPVTHSGSPRADLREFIAATFAGAREAAPVLRTVAGEAQRDPHTAELLTSFATRRRAALREMLTGIRDTLGRPPADDIVDLALDQVFGVLWYRLLISRANLDDHLAHALADRICAQLDAAAG